MGTEASSWTGRNADGTYQRIGNDGATVLVEIYKGITATRNGGYKECWNAFIYANGQDKGPVSVREGFKTLRDAKDVSEFVWRQARKDFLSGYYPT